MGERVLQPGEVVFSVGDPSDRAFQVESGRVEICDDRNGTPYRLAELGPGEIFGEMGLVDERPRTLTARALELTRLSTVTRDEFEDMLFHRPQESLRYLRTLFERLRAMNSLALTRGPEPAWGEGGLRIRLRGVTPEAREALPEEGLVVSSFPFRIGRASQSEGASLDANDLPLDDHAPYHLSRSHATLDLGEGGLVVRDRGSYLGTVVNGVRIGGHHAGAEEALQPGRNELILGADKSPFRFEVVVETITH